MQAVQNTVGPPNSTRASEQGSRREQASDQASTRATLVAWLHRICTVYLHRICTVLHKAEYGANTVQYLRCKHGANGGANTVQTVVQIRCKCCTVFAPYSALCRTVQIRCNIYGAKTVQTTVQTVVQCCTVFAPYSALCRTVQIRCK